MPYNLKVDLLCRQGMGELFIYSALHRVKGNLLSGRELESVKAYFKLNVMQPSESINNSLLSCLHALEIKINCNKFMLLY